jgi:hypothetical protein
VTVGLAAFLAVAGAGVAFAVSGSGGSTSSGSAAASSTSSTTLPSKGLGPRNGPFGRPGFLMGPGMGGAIHGIYTVRNGTGYKTIEMQIGMVQPGNTTTSLTVKSADGYSQTYVVQPSTVVNSQAGGISTVKSGDNVRIQAVQQGSGYTATDIVDTTQVGSSRQGFGFTGPNPPSNPTPPNPTPSNPTPSTGGSTSTGPA